MRINKLMIVTPSTVYTVSWDQSSKVCQLWSSRTSWNSWMESKSSWNAHPLQDLNWVWTWIKSSPTSGSYRIFTSCSSPVGSCSWRKLILITIPRLRVWKGSAECAFPTYSFSTCVHILLFSIQSYLQFWGIYQAQLQTTQGNHSQQLHERKGWGKLNER